MGNGPEVAVQSIMTEHVLCFTLHHTVQVVLIQLATRDFTGAPVINDAGKVIGVVSIMDLLLAASIGKAHLKLGELPLTITPEKEVVTLPPDAPVKAAILLILKKKIGRVIIVDKTRTPVGIVTRKDITRFILSIIA